MRRLAVLPLLLAIACSDHTGPGELSISIATNAATLKAGETLDVTVTVLNLTGSAQTIITNGCPRPFEVRNSEAELVGPGGEVCLAYRLTQTIQPGDTYTFPFKWNGDSRSFPEGATPVSTNLPTGKYFLRGVVPLDAGGTVVGGGVEVWIVP
jgi:hypothetical protein